MPPAMVTGMAGAADRDAGGVDALVDAEAGDRALHDEPIGAGTDRADGDILGGRADLDCRREP